MSKFFYKEKKENVKYVYAYFFLLFSILVNMILFHIQNVNIYDIPLYLPIEPNNGLTA